MDSRVTEGGTGSLVKLGVDGNLKVIVVEVGRLVQHRQHILDHIQETTRVIVRERNKEILKLGSLTGNMSCWFP